MCKVATGKQLTEIEKVRQEFDKAWKELSDKGIDTVVENAKVKNNTAQNDGVKYSINEELNNDSKVIIQTIKDNVDKIDNNIKFEVQSEKIPDNIRKSDYVFSIFSEQGRSAINPEIGVVELCMSGAKSTVFHGFGKEKLAAVRAIKSVIENGNIIQKTENYDNKGYDRYFIASKGMINDKNAFVGVIVKSYPKQKNSNSKFYLHEAIITEEDSPIMTAPQLSVDTVSESSNDIISNSVENVNRQYLLSETNDATSDTNNTRFSLSEVNNTLEKVEKTLYNKNNPLSIVDRASKNNNSSINWVYKAEIFSVKENMLFHEMISEINQGSQAFGKNSIDEYMLPIGNKIVFTDGNYDLPYVREVIEVLTESQTEFEDIKECVFSVEKGESTKHETARYVQNTFGEGRVISYTSRNNGVYGWEDRRRKGKTRRTVVKNYLNKLYGRGNDSQINETKADLNGSASFMPEDIAPVRKSLSNTDEQSTTVGTPLKDLAFEQDIAPVRDDVNYQNQGTNVSQDFPVVNRESENSGCIVSMI